MRKLKKNTIVQWRETDFSHVHNIPKLRYQRKELIHKTALKYLEKASGQSDHDFDILCKLMTAYENA